MFVISCLVLAPLLIGAKLLKTTKVEGSGSFISLTVRHAVNGRRNRRDKVGGGSY